MVARLLVALLLFALLVFSTVLLCLSVFCLGPRLWYGPCCLMQINGWMDGKRRAGQIDLTVRHLYFITKPLEQSYFWSLH